MWRNHFDCDFCQYGRHCDASNPSPYELFTEPYRSVVCYKPMVSELSALMIRLYDHYDHGYLPDAGGVLDQNNFILACFEIIKNRLHDGSKN